MKLQDKLFMIWAIVLMVVILIAFGFFLRDKVGAQEKIEIEAEKEEYSIDEPLHIIMEFATTGEWHNEFRPQLFLKITNTDLSRCLINNRLRIDLNGQIYWIRLEKD